MTIDDDILLFMEERDIPLPQTEEELNRIIERMKAVGLR